MTHRIYLFGSVALPPSMPEDDLSTGQVDSTLVDSVGSTYDAWGTARRLARRQTINLRGAFELSNNGAFPGGASIYLVTSTGDNIVDHLGNKIIVDSAPLAMRRNVTLLKAQTGTRQRLYRRREDDGVISWKLARLLKVGYMRVIDDAGAVANLEMAFETHQAGWRNNTATTVAASLPAGLSIANGGDITVYDAVLTVTATGTITSIAITGTPTGLGVIDLSWTGSLTAGQALVIDAGAGTVRIGSNNQYAGFSRGAGHTAAGWLPIPAGANVILVTGNAAGTASITFNEQVL